MSLTPSALALGVFRLLYHRTSILINKMRKTIASQNIIGPHPHPSFCQSHPSPVSPPHSLYSLTPQNFICDSLFMTSFSPTTAHHPPNSPFQAPKEAENKGLIALNRVPLTDDSLVLSQQSNMDHHPTSQAQGLTSQPHIYPTQPNSHLLHNNSSILSQPENSSMLQYRLEVDMAQEINKYFEQCASSIHEFETYKDKLVMVCNHKIGKQIKRGQLQVSEKCEEVVLKGGERAKSIEAKRRQVELEKYETIRKLKTIQQQQIDLVHRSIKQGRNKSIEMKKSPFTHQQREKIAAVLKAKKQFQKSLIQKTDNYIKNHQQYNKLKEEQQKRMQQIENSRKKQEIARRLRQMELKTQQRKQSLKQSTLKIPHKYVHKQIQRKYRSLQMIAEEQMESKLKEISNKHKLNIEQINEHDRKYSELLEKRSQSLTLIKIPPLSETRRYNLTKFGKVVEEQLFEIKQQNMRKLMKVKENEYKAKISKYQQKIDQQHKPKVDASKSIQAISRAYSSVSLTKQERVEKGLEYLAKAKQMKRSASQIAEPPKVEQNYGYKAYKDYLKERESSENVNATQKQLKEIMAKKDNKDYRQLLRAKFLAEGLEEKSKKRTDDKLYFSAKIKLSLLSQLYSQD